MNNTNTTKNLLLILGFVIIIGLGTFIYKNSKIIKNPNQNTNTDIKNNKEEIKSPSDILDPGVKVQTQSEKEKEIGRLFDQAAKQQAVKDFSGAKKSLEQALKLDPKEAYIMQTYASVLHNSGDTASALIWIDKAIELQPSETHFWYLKIDLYKAKSKGDYATMNPIYLDAIKKTNTDIDMVTAYASYLASIGKKSDSIKQWERAITLNPESKDLYQKEIDSLK